MITILLSAWEYTANRKKLREISEQNKSSVLVKRKINDEDFSGLYDIKNLVIGDIIELNTNCVIPCDLLVITGTCLINEALLTGESVPILK